MDATPQTPQTAPQPAPPLSPSDERTWAMLAHLSVLLNLVTGFLGPVGALLIYLVYKDRSRYVAFQSMQSFIMQLILWIGGGAITAITWTITGLLSAILIGLLCIPLAILVSLLPVAAIVYGVIGAIQTSQGQDFRYWLVAGWTDSLLAQSTSYPPPSPPAAPPSSSPSSEETPQDMI